jgi:hypothetical protein
MHFSTVWVEYFFFEKKGGYPAAKKEKKQKTISKQIINKIKEKKGGKTVHSSFLFLLSSFPLVVVLFTFSSVVSSFPIRQ